MSFHGSVVHTRRPVTSKLGEFFARLRSIIPSKDGRTYTPKSATMKVTPSSSDGGLMMSGSPPFSTVLCFSGNKLEFVHHNKYS